tara:strand:- start:2 stop:319 length:318 start_codon:yes stop_codon:yes gene_type:complete
LYAGVFLSVFPKDPTAVLIAEVITILFFNILQIYILKYKFQLKFLFLDKEAITASNKNINVALFVVKKLPVDLIGNISAKKMNIKGVIKKLELSSLLVKYFFIRD